MTSRRYLVSDTTHRACSRCGESLTDPASREHGVGPVCRRKDTHLYAKTIEANFATASARALGIVPDMLHPETHSLWRTTVRDLFTQMKAAQTDSDYRVWTGTDQREIIRSLDFLLSYRHPHASTRQMIIEVIANLGYVGLAGVLSGDASTTTATLSFANGRVSLVGASCTPGFRAMRRIPGIVLPRHRGSRLPYTAPASQAVAFCNVVRTHWPMYEGDMTAILAQAASHVAANPPVVAAPVVRAVELPVMRLSDDLRAFAGRPQFSLTFPWRRDMDMFGFVNSLKATVPYTARSYNPSTKVWTISRTQWSAVEELCRRAFGGVNAFAMDASMNR
jgi:hypothetical protein